MNSQPAFRTETKIIKGIKQAVLWLLCSNCNADIREITDNESINVTRGYYCADCDDGAYHINFPK